MTTALSELKQSAVRHWRSALVQFIALMVFFVLVWYFFIATPIRSHGIVQSMRCDLVTTSGVQTVILADGRHGVFTEYRP